MSAIGLTVTQRQRVERVVRADAMRLAEESRSDINVIPFLDIVMNVLMFVLATSATLFTAEHRLASVPCCGHAPERESLTVQVTPRGYVLGARAGFIAPGCTVVTAGGGTTVPLRDGRYDGAALSRCLSAVKASAALGPALDGQRSIQVSAAGQVPYAELVRALDAVRETTPGAMDLFPDAVLGTLL